MKRSSQFITLLIKKESLVFACAEYNAHVYMPTEVFIREIFAVNTFIQGRIFNFERAFCAIKAYMSMIHCNNTKTGIIFDTSLIKEYCAPSYEQVLIQSSLESYHTQRLSFGLSPDESFIYTAAISCDLLMQYELLCTALQLPLVFVSTPFQACVQAYRVLYGSAFRQSLLVDVFARYGTELYQGIDQSLVARLMQQPSWDVSVRDNILCAGSFYCMKELL